MAWLTLFDFYVFVEERGYGQGGCQSPNLISSHQNAFQLHHDIHYHEGEPGFSSISNQLSFFLESRLAWRIFADRASPPPAIPNVYESCQLSLGCLRTPLPPPIPYIHISNLLYTYASLSISPIGPLYPVRQLALEIKELSKSMAFLV